jgi:signal transduction histidine kinase
MVDACLPLIADRSFWAELKSRITDTDPVSRAPQTGEIKLSDGRLSQWRTKPLPDGATLVVFSDITATRSLEHAIIARDDALTDSIRLKREFVANVSYELRTPLTTILGFSELMRSKSSLTTPKDKSYLDAIHTSAKELARSIDDVLDMAQIDAGEMDIIPKAIDLNLIEAQIRDDINDILKLRKLKLIVTGFSSDQPLMADPKRLLQILGHLVEYAARNASQSSQLELKYTGDKDDISFVIAYKGRGIPYHVQAHIFDRFVGRERGGPGLALALVKALVELQEGMISLQSEPTEGASFTVTLPQKQYVISANITPKKSKTSEKRLDKAQGANA